MCNLQTYQDHGREAICRIPLALREKMAQATRSMSHGPKNIHPPIASSIDRHFIQPCQRHSMHVKHRPSVPEVIPHARSSQTPTTTPTHSPFFPPLSLKKTTRPSTSPFPLPPTNHSSSSSSSSHPHPLHSAHTQTPPHPLPNLSLKLPSPLPPHLRRLNIRGALIIRLC